MSLPQFAAMATVWALGGSEFLGKKEWREVGGREGERRKEGRNLEMRDCLCG